jgi:hypothetical protein
VAFGSRFVLSGPEGEPNQSYPDPERRDDLLIFKRAGFKPRGLS